MAHFTAMSSDKCFLEDGEDEEGDGEDRADGEDGGNKDAETSRTTERRTIYLLVVVFFVVL